MVQMIETLWVGDAENVPQTLTEDDGFSVRAVPAEDAVGSAEESDTDCVVFDADSTSGVGEKVEALRRRIPELPFVVVTSSELFAGTEPVVIDHVPRNEGWEEVLADVVRSSVEERSHTSYPLPDDDDVRAREVEEVAALDLRDRFDRLTEIGRLSFETDMCFVGLLKSSREVFLSCRGASLETLPREQTVCTYQILDEGVTVIDDIFDDPRFESRELLHDLGMKFYAGAPIVTESGTKLGSFCVMHSEPRDFGADEVRKLSLFAEEAAEKISLLRGRG
jgi:hypothetical protein